MKTKMMITGASGFLGGRLAHYYRDKYEILAPGHYEMEITDGQSVRRYIAAAKPDVVLHCAAVSDTGTCEKYPEQSSAVNVNGTVNIAGACADTGCRLIFMSSDQIYAGIPLKDREFPLPNPECGNYSPAGSYGRQKLQAEMELSVLLPDAVCLRLSWMYDLPVRNRKTNNNLLCGVTKSLITGTPFTAPVYDYRGITDVNLVAATMEQAISLPGGVYNFGCGSHLNTFETARQLADLLAPGRDGLILEDRERFAGHPRNLLMDLEKSRKSGILFPDTMDGLKLCLKEYQLLPELQTGNPDGKLPPVLC